MNVDQELARLETMVPAELRQHWVELTASVVPRVSPRLLRLALAWELQAKAYGGLSRETTRTLDQLARGLTKTAPAPPACGWCASGKARCMSSTWARTR